MMVDCRIAATDRGMFASFFMAGFECTTGYNLHGQWIDQIAATQHDVRAADDYRNLAALNIRAARDGIRWPLVQRGSRYDFASLDPILEASQAAGVEVIYDLFHFGYPEHLDPFASDFAARFADYCHAAARHVSSRSGPPYTYCLINEPSYYAWAAGEVGRFAPYRQRQGWELKVALCRAAISGTYAIWDACPAARIVSVDALCRAVPARDADAALIAATNDFNDRIVFQCWDMLAGRLLPELGGSPAHLGTVGINYYWNNQWELGNNDVPLADNDIRRLALGNLISNVWQRYGAEMVISETSHCFEMRAPWFQYVLSEVQTLMAAGVPLRGICLYPILGMPEWHAPDTWIQMGLWDVSPEGTGLKRVLYEPLADALRASLVPSPGITRVVSGTGAHHRLSL